MQDVPAGAGSWDCVSGHVDSEKNINRRIIKFRKCIKDYKVIGWGSCSDVIVSGEIGDEYVIKRVVKSILNSKRIGYYFNEISCLEKISCSSIIIMKSVFQTEITYNLVLERGVNDLYHFSEGLEYSDDRLDKVVKDLCKAIEYIHNLGVYHRDIKPENVIVFIDNRLNHTFKLCDFGLAVMDSDIGRGSVGSPGFYSPEMSSYVEYSRKYADYWGLGCLILEGIIGNNRFISEWLCDCYKQTSGLELANKCNDVLESYYKKTNKKWLYTKSLLNPIPDNRSLPHLVRRRTSSLDRIIDFMERKKILSQKYDKICPIED